MLILKTFPITPEINRSRAVHIPRYSQKKLTPKTQKVTVIQSWPKFRLYFFKKMIWLISRFARSDYTVPVRPRAWILRLQRKACGSTALQRDPHVFATSCSRLVGGEGPNAETASVQTRICKYSLISTHDHQFSL